MRNMYLYKYVSKSVLDKIIEKKMIRFTQTCYLNDPYEGHIYEDPSNEFELEPYFKKQIESGEILAKEIRQLQIESISNDPSRVANAVAKAKHDFDHKYGVLSLSRNPRSLLMWAHYAENHKGCVVELNKNSLPKVRKSLVTFCLMSITGRLFTLRLRETITLDQNLRHHRLA